MYLTSALMAFAASIITVSATTVPEGNYVVTRFSNGTQVYDSTENGVSPIVLTPEDVAALQAANRRDMLSSATLSKRRTDCWGYQLEEFAIDRLFESLTEGYAGNGETLCADEPNTTKSVQILRNQMMVYYCINQPGQCGNLNREDVNYAKVQMDAKCRRYEASWFEWPGSYEIVGKARQGADVCKGGMNGVPF
ncbi:hypothetical protein COCC4DRAFT_35999 [Bipolaris maydis ATCC 48331]|uniref:Ecp2 effector protein domain-containing protein n=2 Tax=Cochliobolus heterostrophus TaxID=5016 RepID=M2UCM1_COCH5|nr:uncharacterized protein COCC4DRAFT_35999 [Bipolaris maydis ATCC 48331]EMD96309.1 hypothetical protein COCHEDRAFT_1167417 [Bipolaris maydis C5]KAJ5030963.1 hypothetical protein J3E73DRAFT_378927 [Bipolaris maydis]ENI11169.1 hypothetical protein COCC4DRAFT_35999 [Bipolaris maydis ATCC 48331]KAJ5065985.1 hypothetical protein J3E74DRAFT_414894 [Bipolaris maydis]KAJ6201185.1 hypothetical protein J3E72DRAFT_413247 [Bipolaris maydis]